MKNLSSFNMVRIWQLITNDIRLHSKAMLIVAAIIVIIMALFPFHFTGSATAYFLILYIGGFIITGLAFNDLHDRRKAYFTLTLPCSNLERFVHKWFVTSMGYALALLVIYYLFSWLSVMVNFLVFHRQINPVDISQLGLWIGIGEYIVLQSIILLGAITFKKYTLLKTALALGCLIIIFSLMAVIFTWIFCPNCVIEHGFQIYSLMRGAYFIFWIIAAPFCWYITYLRLAEYELR